MQPEQDANSLVLICNVTIIIGNVQTFSVKVAHVQGQLDMA